MCVQPALAESMPLAVLEAGAVGVPLAVSDIPGHDELIFLGSTGYRFAPGDPMDCARVMRAALRDAEGSIRMGLTFRERVLMELTWERSVQRYCRKYGLHTEASEQ
jgi:glycosyltransferase involved in cell wall biosynthesis